MAMAGCQTIRCTRHLTRHIHSTPTVLKYRVRVSRREKLAAPLTLPKSITDKSKRRIMEFEQIPYVDEETDRPSIVKRLPDQFQPKKTARELAREAQEENEKKRVEREAKIKEREADRAEKRERRRAMNLMNEESDLKQDETSLQSKDSSELEGGEEPTGNEEKLEQKLDESSSPFKDPAAHLEETVVQEEGSVLQEDQEFQSGVEINEDQSSETPINILGDLESLFGQETPPSEPTVQPEDAPIVTEGVRAVDYSVYFTHSSGERTEMEDAPLSRYVPGNPVPLDHLVRFLRDSKCFDTEIIQAEDHHQLEHVVITSVRNYRHLRDTSLTFSKMVVRDYGRGTVRRDLGKEWCYFDLGHCVVHFLLPVERARINLESSWLGLDHELVSVDLEKSYTDGLLEGIFPDEDFTRLATPFELVREDSDKSK